LGNLIKIYS